MTSDNPLPEALGQMLMESINREANLRAQLIVAQRRIAELTPPEKAAPE